MNKQCGFNLIELLITIVVASILTAVAVPAFQSFIQNNRISTSSNQLVSAIALARSEAIRRSETITLCASIDLAACSGNTNWETGLIIFNDRNSDAVVDTGATPPEAVLRVWTALPTGITLTAASVSSIQFDRQGVTGLSALEIFQLANPDCKPGQAGRERVLTLMTSGNVTITPTDCP